jgi:hypothetical protein
MVDVCLRLSDDHFGTRNDVDMWWNIEELLEDAVYDAGVGLKGGSEAGGGYRVYFFNGPDADAMFEVLARLVAEHWNVPETYIEKMFGSPDARRERVDLTESGWVPGVV